MKKKNDALTPVVSAILALLIVTSTMSSVLLWGIPYIEAVEHTTEKENTDRQFISVAQSIDDLVNSNPGNKVTNTLDLSGGTISIDTDEKDRTVIMYSFSDEYDFTILLPETCFLAGTKVLMADESYKNIEAVVVGDLVLSYDEKTKEILPCKVTNVFHHVSEEMTPYYLVINDRLKATPNHKFYSAGRWVEAGNLRMGNFLFTREQGTSYMVYSLEKIYERESSFNLEVEDCHTFFVSIDDGVDVLVHNPYTPPSSPNPDIIKTSDGSGGRDSYISSKLGDRDENFGGLTHMWVDCKWNEINRMLLRFWIYSLGIPEDAYIISANLSVYYYDHYGQIPNNRWYECRRITTAWGEGSVTWVDPWTNNGGDYGDLISKIRIGATGVGPNYYGWKKWDVTDSVAEYINGIIPSHSGFIIKDETETTGQSWAAQFRSKEWSGTTYDPYLEIYWATDPEGQTNEPTNVGQTSLTLNGEVVDNGREPVQHLFYGQRTYASGMGTEGDFGSWTGSNWTGQTFDYIQSGLKRGTYGWYQAKVKHSFGGTAIDTGETVYFLLQPAPLTDLTADIINPGLINLSWTNGDGGVGAYIEYATGSKPDPWDVGEGIPVNDSEEYGYVAGESYSHTVNPDTTYYYKAWAYAEDGPGPGYDEYISDGTDAFPFGGSMETPGRTTNEVPTVTTHDATDNISTIATLHGALLDLEPLSDYSYCNVGFEYGLSDGYGKNVSVGNLTENQDFSANIIDLTPGKTYHFRAFGEVEEYPYRFYGSDKTFTTWIDGIFILSPGDRYEWRRGTTQNIEWAYNPLIGDHHVNITWQRDGEEGPISNDIPINMGLYNWSINLTQPLGYLNYTIKITSNNDTGIYDTSGLFSIIELHEEIIDNVTVWGLDIQQGETKPVPILGPTFSGREIKLNELFYLTMNGGETTRAEVYWLDYGVKLEEPLSLSGAVCIDLYNDGCWFGSIWIIDSDSISYESFSSIGDQQKITMENGGIINSHANSGHVQMSPPIFAGKDIFSIHAVQLIGPSTSAGGMSRFKIKMDADLYMNRIREQEYVYNLRLQFYGDNHEAWITYFTSNYEFEKDLAPLPPNTLFYTPSLSKLWFAFAHSSVKLSLHT